MALLFLGIFSQGISVSGYTDFITDTRLILNYDLYSALIEKIRNFSDTRIFNLFMLSLFPAVIIPLFTRKKPNPIFLAIIIGALSYLIIASKVIFFHNYYLMPPIIAVSLGGTIFIYFYTHLFSGFRKHIMLVLLIVFFLPRSIYGSIDYINRENPGTREMVEFMRSNLEKDEFTIVETGNSYSLPIYTGTPILLDTNLLNHPTISTDIQNFRFKEAMDKYHIKYVLTYEKEPNYLAYASALLGRVSQTTKCNRTDLILAKFGEEVDCGPDKSVTLSVEEDEFIRQHFRLEKIVDKYQIYSFQSVPTTYSDNLEN